MCVCVCVFVHIHTKFQLPVKAKKINHIYWSWSYTASWATWHESWEVNFHLMQDQQMFLAAEQVLQLQIHNILGRIWICVSGEQKMSPGNGDLLACNFWTHHYQWRPWFIPKRPSTGLVKMSYHSSIKNSHNLNNTCPLGIFSSF